MSEAACLKCSFAPCACKSFNLARERGRLLDANGRILATRHPAAWITAITPILAAKLAHRLVSREPAPPLKALGGKPALQELVETRELITEAQWTALTALLERETSATPGKIHGVGLTYAELRSVGVQPWLLERFLRNADLRHRWRIARLIARHRWCPIDEILDDILNTGLSVVKICARRGISYSKFLRLSQDPYIAEQYLEAKAVQQMQLNDSNESDVDAALKGAASRKAIRQTMRTFNKETTRVRGLRPARLRARAVLDPAIRLEAAAVARRRAAKAP
jgi:hypothetical protein